MIDCSLLMFHHLFKVYIVKPLILFIFKDTTYVFYPKGRKKSAYEKFPPLLTHSSAENEQRSGAPFLSAGEWASLSLQGIFAHCRKHRGGGRSPAEPCGHLQMLWLCAQASLSVLQCLVLALPSLHLPLSLLHITTGDAVRRFPSIPNHSVMIIFI